MVEEVLRRLRNCDPDASWGERGKHLTTFAASMMFSGHSEHFRRTVFNKAVHRFCLELDAHKAGVSDIYRSREERIRQLQAKGGKSTKDNWFRRVEGGERVTSVFRVPYTRGGELKERVAKSLKQNAAPKGIKTKVQESSGLQLKGSLMKSDPFPRDVCHRDGCPLTRGSRKCREQCFQSHCNYAILCSRCDPPDDVSLAPSNHGRPAHSQPASGGTAPPPRSPRYLYLGESSRGCYIRFQSHITKYKLRKNFMWDHVQKVHDGEQGVNPGGDFYMQLVGVDREPMPRVVRESVGIKNAREEERKGGYEVMNDKNEWFGVKVVTAAFKQE